jgi:RNA polymerase sigma factor (sigma-70 family)
LPRTEMVQVHPLTFDGFYRGEYERAVRFAWLLTGAPVAEDLAQDAFVSMERHFEELDDPVRYLMKTMLYRARTWQRDERRRRLKLARAHVETQTVVLDDPADGDLLAAVRALPYRQRAVVVMRYWAGWSEADIAVALDCRAGTVKSLSSRALARLRIEVTS